MVLANDVKISENYEKTNRSRKPAGHSPAGFSVATIQGCAAMLYSLFTYTKSGERKKANETDEKASRMAVVCNADFHGTADNCLCG